MRLLTVVTRLNIGGPAPLLIAAHRGLASRGYECLLVHGSLHKGETSIKLERFGEAGHLVYEPSLQRSIHPVADFRAAVRLSLIIRSFRPDIIHTHLTKAGVLGRAAGMAYGKARLVHTYHGNMAASFFGPTASRLFVAVERWLGSHSDALIALSPSQLHELEHLRIGHARNRAIVELAVDLGPYRRARSYAARADARSRVGLDQDSTVVLFGGRLVPVKRVDWLLRVMAPLLSANPKLVLIVAGDGPERPKLENLSRALGIPARVRFEGWVDKMADWYASADLVALASSWEGTPLAIIEAMASARVAVATDVGGIRDIVENGRTGVVVGKDDDEGFRRAVHELVTDGNRRDHMAANAAAASERFCPERLVDDLDRIYHRVLATSTVAAT